MIVRQGWFGILCLGMVIAAGCDKPTPPPPQTSAKPPSDVSVPPVPTTQELMTGPYKRVLLLPLPLSAQVPKSWDCTTPEGTQMTFLEGPAPGGRSIRISLEIGRTIKPDELKNILEGAKRAAAKSKDKVQLDIRSIGDAQVLEERRLNSAATTPQDQPMDWKVTYFVHTELDYGQYVVDVIGLTAGQYEQSKDLLRKIFDSITYQPPPGG